MNESKSRVLIVDDNHDNLNVLYGILQKKYNVFAAERGELVQEMALTHKPDIIILDIMMPGLNGYDVCEKLKKNKLTFDIPVIFMSALSESIDIVRGFEAGGVDYVTKPYQKDVVLKRIAIHIELANSRKKILEFNSLLKGKVKEKTKELEKKIDEITKMNLAIRENEDKYRKLFTSSPEAILIINATTHEVLDANSSALELFDCQLEEIIGKSQNELFDNNAREYDSSTPDYRKNNQERVMFKNKILRNNGEKADAEITSRLILIEGEICQQVVIRDITIDVKYKEGLKEAKRKSDELGKLKSGFLKNMVHELKTPLIGILGYSEILTQELADELHKSMIEGILNTGQRLLKTLNLLIDLAMIGEENHKFKIEPMNIVDTFNEACAKYEAKIKLKGLKLIKKVSETVINVSADERMLFSLFCNLIGNALKFTEDGEIKVSVEKNSYENKVAVIIEDTGIGISKDKIDMIFEEFRQESEGVSRDYQGLGIGLTISKKFADYNSGELFLESEKGKGTKVILKFNLL